MSESYKNAATRPTTNTTALGTATLIPPFELLWVLPDWVGTGFLVELEREEGDVEILPLLLLPGRLDEGLEGREEGPEREDEGKELPLARRVPVPQAILSPFGWVVSDGGVLFPFGSVMVNLVVQYF